MKANPEPSVTCHDREVSRILDLEAQRQAGTIDLIASENHIGRAVLRAQGSLMTDKYAEGYPGRRYYGGCANVDEVENLAIERARRLFQAEHANVQPHSGSQANMAVYLALLKYGDTVMGMSRSHGGHLTHGAEVNFSGKWFTITPYGVDRKSELLDYDEIERLALKHKPRLIIAGASAYSRTIDFQRFREVADKVGAMLLADIAHIAGIIAAGLHPSPVPHAHVVTCSTQKTLRGPRGGLILCQRELGPAVDAAVFPGMQGGPLMHAIAAKAICLFEALQPEFVDYQRAVLSNARVLASELEGHGLRIITGGTDNHLALVDLSFVGISGRDAEKVLEAVGILVNRNSVPFDSRPPLVTSGIRIGTPAVTTRGFGIEEMKRTASLIVKVLSHPGDEHVAGNVREEVRELCACFPIPGLG